MRGGCARADFRAARLDRDDRLDSRDPRGKLEKAARIPEALDVHENHADCRIVLPLLEQVVAANVGLVADRDELRNADAVLRRVIKHAYAQRTRL